MTAKKKAPIVVSVINLKGGVGKTTVAVFLARYAALLNLNVLVADLDPQANASQALMGERGYGTFMSNHEFSMVELFAGVKVIPPSGGRAAPAPLSALARKVGGKSNLHLVPSRFDFADDIIKSAKVDDNKLAEFIAHEMGDKDLVLIDCAPTESVLTQAAYRASRYIIVPVKTDFFSTIGFPLLRESLREFKRNNPGHAIDVLGVLINNTPGADADRSREEIINLANADATDEDKWPVFENEMTPSTGYAKKMRDEWSRHTGKAPDEFALVGEEIITKLGLAKKEE